MNTRSWISPFVFLAGYAPLGLILLIKDFDTKTWWFSNPVAVGVVVVLILVSVALTMVALKSITFGHPITIVRAQESSGSLLEYSLPYVFSFLDVGFDDGKSMICMGIFLALLYVVARRTQTLFHSPMLIVLGYHLYFVEYLDTGKEKNSLILTERPLEKGLVCRAHSFAPGTLFVTNDDDPRAGTCGRKRPVEEIEGGPDRDFRDEFVGDSQAPA